MFNLTHQLLLAALLLSTAASHAATERELADFFLAAQMDDATSMRKMLTTIGNPNTRDPLTGATALILALREGAEHVIPVMIADKHIDLEATAANGNTALMMAAFKRNTAAVQALIDRGAQVNRPGWTALHYAAASGDDASIRILLAHKAAIDARSPIALTPLMLAAREGQETAVAALLDAGADATLLSSENMDAAQIADKADKPRIAAAIRQHLAR